MTQKVEYDIIAHDKASKTFDSVGGSASRSAGSLKKFAVIGAGAIAAGAAVAGVALFKMAKMAIEDDAAQAKLAKTLKNTTGASKEQVAGVEAWIAAEGRAKGVTDDELRPSMEKLLTATGSMTEAMQLSELAMDASAGTGKDLGTVSAALMKAQNGNVGALAKLGIETKNAKGETMSFHDVTKKMADTFGGQATVKANTLQGKIDRLKLIFHETAETIGSKMIPILTDVADWFLVKVVPAAGKVASFLSEKLGPAFQKVGDFIMNKVVPPVRDLAGKYLTGLREGFENAKGGAQDIQPFLDLLGSALKGVGKVITNVLFPALGMVYEVAFPALGTGLKLVAKLLGKVGEAGKWMWNNALQPVLKMAVVTVGIVIDAFGKLFSAIGSIKGAPAWIKKTGDALNDAAGKAFKLADGIEKIPNEKNVKINIETIRFNRTGSTAPGGGVSGIDFPGHASGTRFSPGGWRWAGENGRELINFRPGSQVLSNADVGRAMSGGGLSERELARALAGAFRGMSFRFERRDTGQDIYRLVGG
jgi:hypothetical protein